jgi:hypothetical protein
MGVASLAIHIQLSPWRIQVSMKRSWRKYAFAISYALFAVYPDHHRAFCEKLYPHGVARDVLEMKRRRTYTGQVLRFVHLGAVIVDIDQVFSQQSAEGPCALNRQFVYDESGLYSYLRGLHWHASH